MMRSAEFSLPFLLCEAIQSDSARSRKEGVEGRERKAHTRVSRPSPGPKKIPKLSNTRRDDQLTGRFESDKTRDEETVRRRKAGSRIIPYPIQLSSHHNQPRSAERDLQSGSSRRQEEEKRRKSPIVSIHCFKTTAWLSPGERQETFSAIVRAMPRRKQDCPKRMKCKSLSYTPNAW